MNKVNRVILIIIDDVRSDQFYKMIELGQLPTFKKLMENGIYSKSCVTDFPSITYPTQASIVTGTYTGDYNHELCHGIPNFNWMGRDYSPPILRNYASNNLQIYKLNQDLGNNCQTIFEMIKEGNKCSITQFINKGVDYFFPEYRAKLIFYYLIINYWGDVKKLIQYTNSIVIHKLIDTIKNPNKYFELKESPICSLLWFVSSDILMHQYGSASKIYKLNLMHIDKLIGILIKELDNLGILEDTAIAITSDHGNYTAKKFGNLNRFFTDMGLKHYNPNSKKGGNVNLAEFGSVGFFNFNGKLKCEGKNQWGYPTINELRRFGPKQINLVKKLFEIEGIKLMYYRDNDNNFQNGRIFLKKKLSNNKGYLKGSLEYRGSGKEMETRYISENGDLDVFGYVDDKRASNLIDGNYHKIDEWLKYTFHLDYPLYPDLLVRHFKNPRSADLILSTKGEIVYNIVHGKKKKKTLYKHDIGTRESSVVPLIISGSNSIPKKEIKFCKVTDIVPTLIKLLGKKIPESVIGNSLL